MGKEKMDGEQIEITNAQENIKDEKAKIDDIVKKAKTKGKMTYGELASELDDVPPEQIDKVFDAFEEMGVDLLGDSFDDAEPDI